MDSKDKSSTNNNNGSSQGLTSEESLILKQIYKILVEIERNQISSKMESHIFLPNQDFEKLKLLISKLANFTNPQVHKLSQLIRVLKPELTATEWISLVIPFERILNRNITDSEICVNTTDQVKLVRKTYPLRIILDSFRSAFNVGSLFRTSECLGVEHLYLCGYTPTPENKKVLKAALGTEKLVSWSYHTNTEELISEIKNDFHIVALETSPQGNSLNSKFPHKPTALVLGNERFGLDPVLLSHCHEIRKLDLLGSKNSLNVSTCGALAIYEWTSQWNS